MMAGTLFRLRTAGWEIHYMNLANGSCGTAEHSAEEIVAIRRKEARAAAACLEGHCHESLVADLEVLYTNPLIRRVTAVIRRIEPEVMLLPSPEDYMEDHMNTARIAVTAAFCRGMRNFASEPPLAPIHGDVTLYHALPYGLTDGMRRPILPDFYVDITAVMEEKERMLACHQSQKLWLDKSQGLDSYLKTMRMMSREVGRMSAGFEYAEGWRRHSHLGYSREEIDPLQDALEPYCREAGRST
jgi:LmbE family N-acetylglucosaminyl deacetylase